MDTLTAQFLGDSHNFGQRVSFGPKATLYKVRKPRPVIWEFLFLDPTSPLRKLLESANAGAPGQQIARLFGAVPIKTTTQFLTGDAAYVEKVSRPLTSVDLDQLGGLTAFALALGMTDLHGDNVLITAQGLQVVDIECVFWDCQLPSETLLVPRSKDLWPRSVLVHTGKPNDRTLSREYFKSLFNGFMKSMDCLKQIRAILLDFLSRERWLIEGPTRIVLRNTMDYRNMLDGGVWPDDLIAEEKTQLSRGDIPYFWGYAGRQDVHYFKAVGETACVMALNPEQQKKVRRAFVSPEELLTADRLLRIQKQGAIELAAKFLDRDDLPYESDDVKIFVENEFLCVQTSQFGVRTGYK